jgi:hypothetical protein
VHCPRLEPEFVILPAQSANWHEPKGPQKPGVFADAIQPQPSKLPLHVAEELVPCPELTVPAQPLSSQDCCCPQNPGVAEEAMHWQPSKFPLQVAVPSEFWVPAHPLSSHDCC